MFALQLAMIYVPFHPVFHTMPLTLDQLGLCLLLSTIGFSLSNSKNGSAVATVFPGVKPGV